MSNKVYIVLRYSGKGTKEVYGFDVGSCRVMSVYASRKKANKRRSFLERVDKTNCFTFHVIEKTLKGSYCLIN